MHRSKPQCVFSEESTPTIREHYYSTIGNEYETVRRDPAAVNHFTLFFQVGSIREGTYSVVDEEPGTSQDRPPDRCKLPLFHPFSMSRLSGSRYNALGAALPPFHATCQRRLGSVYRAPETANIAHSESHSRRHAAATTDRAFRKLRPASSHSRDHERESCQCQRLCYFRLRGKQSHEPARLGGFERLPVLERAQCCLRITADVDVSAFHKHCAQSVRGDASCDEPVNGGVYVRLQCKLILQICVHASPIVGSGRLEETLHRGELAHVAHPCATEESAANSTTNTQPESRGFHADPAHRYRGNSGREGLEKK